MLRRISHLARAFALAIAAFPAACAGPNAASQLARPPTYQPEGQTKCSIGSSQTRPLIVEWPSPDRGALEAQAKKGIVAVRYVGCEMEVLRQCKVPGAYAYTPLTRKSDHVALTTADDLYAKIPVHAAQFEAKLQQSGQLDVNMTIVGSYEADHATVRADELSGSCAQATHFIAALTAGAFEFSAGATAKLGGGASVGGLGAGAESSAEREILNRDGFKGACEKATGSDKAPPDGCGALLRVEVVPLAAAQPQPAVAGSLRLGGSGASGVLEGGPVVLSSPREQPGAVIGAYKVAPAAPEPPPPSSAAYTIGTIGITGGSLGLTMWLVTGFVAIVEKPSLSGPCSSGTCPPSSAGTLATYHTMGTLATVGLIGGSALLAGGIIARLVAPSARKKPSATLFFDGTGVVGRF